MSRYHKEIYIPVTIKGQFKAFTDKLNTLNWAYTSHSIDNIKDRYYNVKEILTFINSLRLKEKDIFEVYADNDNIIKLCYRIEYDTCDIILVLSKDKTIITIYTNDFEDLHYSLNKSIYKQM